MMIQKIRESLPKSWRLKLKYATGKFSILTFIISLFYGFFLKPSNPSYIYGKKVPKIFVIPDIYAIDCARSIFVREDYEKFYHIKNGDVVVDVGANVGMFTVKAAIKASKVIAIEPEERNLKLLEKNVQLHNLKNVVIIKKALGAKKEKAIMFRSLLSGTHQLKSVEKSPEFPVNLIEVEVDTLDDVVSKFALDRIDFLKIDVEGAELQVLKGGVLSIKITKNIAMELEMNGSVKKFLEANGFVVITENNMLYGKRILT
ncbi:MAG: FkbM family methyltransferase [Candidatus Bathyarchaeia archaeon]